MGGSTRCTIFFLPFVSSLPTSSSRSSTLCTTSAFTRRGWLCSSIAAFLLVFKVRLYSLKVQDRVIRLEERLRLQALAPAEWHTQIYRLTEDQLIGLRFAADDEVVELAKQALEHNLNRKQIKERIKDWRPDNWRV